MVVRAQLPVFFRESMSAVLVRGASAVLKFMQVANMRGGARVRGAQHTEDNHRNREAW
jgi:hypothetical protein